MRHHNKVNSKLSHQVVRDKFNLLTQGVKISNQARRILGETTVRYAESKGIAGGVDLILPGEIHVSTPISSKYTTDSIYTLDGKDKELILKRGEKNLYPVSHILAPDTIHSTNEDGVALAKFGKIYTDRLGISIVKGCKYALVGKGCKFCEIGTKEKMSLNSLSGVKELIQYCEDTPSVNFRHILLTGGCGFAEMWDETFQFIKEVGKCTNRPIYYMTTPVSYNKMKLLREAGVAELGMNMELWDRSLAKEIMPGKGTYFREDYLNAFHKAVSLFGENGEVRSLLIVGLESVENTLEAVETLARNKVMPILSPFRALKGTPMQDWKEPNTDYLFDVWHKCQTICEQHKMTLGPLCKACQNNTITVPVSSAYRYY